MNRALIRSHIVVLYKSLELSSVSTDSFRRPIWDKTPRLIGLDTIIGVQFQELQSEMLLNIPDKRLEAAVQNPTPDRIGLLSEMIEQGVNSIANKSLIAYGINFNVQLTAEGDEDLRKDVRTLFFNETVLGKGHFRGSMLGISPIMYFQDKEKRYQIGYGVDALKGKVLEISMNAHFDKEIFPTRAELEASLVSEKDYLMSTIDHLFSK